MKRIGELYGRKKNMRGQERCLNTCPGQVKAYNDFYNAAAYSTVSVKVYCVCRIQRISDSGAIASASDALSDTYLLGPACLRSTRLYTLVWRLNNHRVAWVIGISQTLRSTDRNACV
jgi:hypothetical protein